MSHPSHRVRVLPPVSSGKLHDGDCQNRRYAPAMSHPSHRVCVLPPGELRNSKWRLSKPPTSDMSHPSQKRRHPVSHELTANAGARYVVCRILSSALRPRALCPHMTEYLVALLPQHGVGQQVNGTRLSTRGRATRRGGCPMYTHATHCAPHEAVLAPKHTTESTKYPTGAYWSSYF
jgi:hypothetical protein